MENLESQACNEVITLGEEVTALRFTIIWSKVTSPGATVVLVIPAGAHFIDVTKSSCNSGIEDTLGSSSFLSKCCLPNLHFIKIAALL